MEQKMEISDFREDDNATMENTEPAMHTLSSSKVSEDWEKISEDWVSLFLDPAILDDHFRSLPLDFESYLQSDSILPKTNNHFSLQGLLTDSLLLHSTNDQLSHSDMALGSSLKVIEDLFGKEDSSLQVDLIHQKIDSQGYNESILPASILTQVSGSSSLEMEVGLWKEKEANLDLSMILKRETNAQVPSRFVNPTSPSAIANGTKSGYSNNSAKNTLQYSSCLLQCKEGKIGSCDVGLEAVARSGSIAQMKIPSVVSQSETFGVRHLQSSGNAIKIGLLRRSGDKGINTQHKKNCEVESFKLQNQEVREDQQSDHNDGNKEGVGSDEGNEKRQVRLLCHHKSDQLSKQQKKVSMDELEDKLRTMAANVVELNNTISHLTAENVNLQRQLGYYCLAPGVCSRLEMPMHVMPIGPFFGSIPGRPMYSGGQMPPISIPRIKTQILARNSKRPTFGATKGRGDKKQIKFKAAGVVSMVVMGFICVVMLFGSVDQSLNGSNVIDDHIQVQKMRVESHLLTNWNKHLNLLNSTEVNLWEFGSSWLPLEPGEYGPERKGVPSVHTQLDAEKLQFETTKLQGITEVGIESFVQHSMNGNATHATFTSLDYFSSKKTSLLMDSKVVPINTSKSFEASVFVLGANGLRKVDGNLIIQAVLASDKTTKKHSNKKCKSGSKKKKEMKQSTIASSKLQAMNSLSTNALNNLMSKESKVLKNATATPFVTARSLSRNINSVVEANNPVLPMLCAGILQQWMLGALHDSKANFVASKLTKKVKSQMSIDDSKAVPVIQKTFYSITPYDAAPRGPLNLWFYSSLSTEPIMCKRNISDNVKEAMLLPITNEERLENLMPIWPTMQPLAYNQLFQKKVHKANTCNVPTLSKLFWAAAASIELAKGPMLNTTMCTKLFQFDKATNTSPRQASNPIAKNMAESVATKVAQGSLYKVTSTIPFHVVPRSRRDPFAVPLLPVKPRSSSTNQEEGHNRTDPREEKTVHEQMHNQNLRHGLSSIVVLVIASPEEYGDSRKKGIKGLSRIFVVVLIDNQKYMTYSCMLPSGGPQTHVVAE